MNSLKLPTISILLAETLSNLHFYVSAAVVALVAIAFNINVIITYNNIIHYTNKPEKSRAVEDQSNILVGDVNSLHIRYVFELHDSPTSIDARTVRGFQNTCIT